ncbi:unnamed protein product [Sphagnum tenellum]
MVKALKQAVFGKASDANEFIMQLPAGTRYRVSVTDNGSFHDCRAFFVVRYGSGVRNPNMGIPAFLSDETLWAHEIRAFKSSRLA